MAFVTQSLGPPTTNAETVQAIFDNIGTIIVGLGYPVEDLSSNPDMVDPWYQMHYTDETFENEYGQRPEYNDVGIILKGQFKGNTPEIVRPIQIEVIHNIREAITVETLNTGFLIDNKLVNFVSHIRSINDYESPVNKTEHFLVVKYREL